MKTKLLILIVLISVSAPAQTPIERNGFVFGPRPQKKTAAQLDGERLAAKNREAAELQKAIQNPDNFRVVNGKTYNVVLSTNWVTLPTRYQRGEFSRMTKEGAVFALESENSKSWGPGISQGTTWYEYDREVIIKNFPGKNLIAGQPMPNIRVMPIRTSASGVAIYDYGTPPKTATNGVATITNTPAK